MNAVSPAVSSAASKAAWICLAIAWACFLIPIPGVGIIVGWPLNLVAFILAIVAMAKAGAMAGIAQLLSSLVISPIVYFVGLAVLAGAISSASIGDRDSKVDVALTIARNQVANDIDLKIRRDNIRVSDMDGDHYYVCGDATLNRPGAGALTLNNAFQNVLITVNRKTRRGAAIFDGSKDPGTQATFWREWNKRCKTAT